MNYDLKYTPKSLREAFSYSQAHLPNTPQGSYFRSVLQDLIDEMEKHRPTGPDGKHNNLHTDTCGCEDK